MKSSLKIFDRSTDFAGSSSSSSADNYTSAETHHKKQINSILNKEIVIDPARKKIAIIGAGIAGCCTALELAKRGFSVILFEKNESLLSGTSNSTPGHLDVGFQYQNKKTAISCLAAVIRFIRKFNEDAFVVGNEDNNLPLLMQSNFFITSSGISEHAQVQRLLKILQEEYIHLIKLDPENRVFGEPEAFFIPMSVDAYKDSVNLDKVYYGFTMVQRTLNWPKFKTYIIEQITAFEKQGMIAVHTQNAVSHIARHGFEFAVHTKHQTTNTTYLADTVVVAAWQGTQAINNASQLPNIATTHSIKAMVTIKIASQYIENYLKSTFFCHDPSCSVTNVGKDEEGNYIFHILNIASHLAVIQPDQEIPEDWVRCLDGCATLEEQTKHAAAIVAVASEFTPWLKELSTYYKILRVSYSCVLMPDDLPDNILAPESHAYTIDGTRALQVGIVETYGRTLVSSAINGEDIAYAIGCEHLIWIERLRHLQSDKLIAESTVLLLQQYFTPKLLSSLIENDAFYAFYKEVENTCGKPVLSPLEISGAMQKLTQKYEALIAINDNAIEILETAKKQWPNQVFYPSKNIQVFLITRCWNIDDQEDLREITDFLQNDIINQKSVQLELYILCSDPKKSISDLKEMLHFLLNIKKRLLKSSDYIDELWGILCENLCTWYRHGEEGIELLSTSNSSSYSMAP